MASGLFTLIVLSPSMIRPPPSPPPPPLPFPPIAGPPPPPPPPAIRNPKNLFVLWRVLPAGSWRPFSPVGPTSWVVPHTHTLEEDPFDKTRLLYRQRMARRLASH